MAGSLALRPFRVGLGVYHRRDQPSPGDRFGSRRDLDYFSRCNCFRRHLCVRFADAAPGCVGVLVSARRAYLCRGERRAGCWHLHFESESTGTWFARGERGIHGCAGYARTRDWPRTGRTLPERSAPARLSSDAIQLCCVHKRIGHPIVAAAWFQDRRHFARSVSTSRDGICRCSCHVPFASVAAPLRGARTRLPATWLQQLSFVIWSR
jgi:hypothetical protein